MLTRGLGIGFIVVGSALTYNFLAFSPAHRLGGHQFDALLFFGPIVLVIGVLLTSGLKVGATADSAYANLLYRLGLLFVAIPVGLLAFSFLSGFARGPSGIAGMLGVITVVLLGLPGLVLIVWSGRIRSWFF